MTQSIYICAGSFCVTLVVCALVRLISPTGSTLKILSLVLGVFALCSLLYPLKELFSEFDFQNKQMSELELTQSEVDELCDEEVMSVTANYINTYTGALLQEMQISPNNIETVLAVNDTKGIYVKAMNIYITESDSLKKEDISELIYSTLQVEPLIITE